MKPEFYLRMLKPNSSQSSGCTRIHRTSQKILNICQEADGICFLGQEWSADGGINATGDHNAVRSVL
jgi:hypothetical protein